MTAMYSKVASGSNLISAARTDRISRRQTEGMAVVMYHHVHEIRIVERHRRALEDGFVKAPFGRPVKSKKTLTIRSRLSQCMPFRTG